MPVFDVTVVTGPYADGQLHVKKREEYEIQASSYGVAGSIACVKFMEANRELVEKEKYYVQATNIRDKNSTEELVAATSQVSTESPTKRRGRPPKNKN